MKLIILYILTLAAAPVPKNDPICIGSPDQVIGAKLSGQDPNRSCNHNHLVAHIGLQRDAGVNSKYPGTPILPKPKSSKGYRRKDGYGVLPTVKQFKKMLKQTYGIVI